MIGIVWFRQDLRVHDNPALYQACEECEEVIPVFIHDTSVDSTGAASRVWLHRSLIKLDSTLQSKGSKLVLKQGQSLQVLQQLISEKQASGLPICVYWNRCYEPETRQRDEEIKTELKKCCGVKSFKGNVIFEPWEVLKDDGTPYKVFTPYWKRVQREILIEPPLTEPKNFKSPLQWPSSLSIDALGLLPVKPMRRWDTEVMSTWKVGEYEARHRLDVFLSNSVCAYKKVRDFPAIEGTSKLSPYLHFGEISPKQIFYQANIHKVENFSSDSGVTHLLRQVSWREFAYSLLYYFPQTTTQPLNKKFEYFEWGINYQSVLKHWKTGMTGFPIIDAGMRELWHTGWMHNRVRMIVASFLTKNLLIPWQVGEAWFRDTLVDADIANNIMGWQWVAGCGADAAPYFRIFNPTLQSKKFDGEGHYIRRWVPELKQLENKYIHEPSVAQAEQCAYPLRIVDLKATRERALRHYGNIKSLS